MNQCISNDQCTHNVEKCMSKYNLLQGQGEPKDFNVTECKKISWYGLNSTL